MPNLEQLAPADHMGVLGILDLYDVKTPASAKKGGAEDIQQLTPKHHAGDEEDHDRSSYEHDDDDAGPRAVHSVSLSGAHVVCPGGNE
jgi:hypothetical protein